MITPFDQYNPCSGPKALPMASPIATPGDPYKEALQDEMMKNFMNHINPLYPIQEELTNECHPK